MSKGGIKMENVIYFAKWFMAGVPVGFLIMMIV